MDDLISRQEAIDAVLRLTNCQTVRELYEYIQDQRNPYDMWIGGVNDAIDAVIAVPSAQPEQRWIPVSERLPNFAQRVLVSTANFVYEAIYFDEDAGWSTYNVTFKDVDESEILAWMPLPAKYREED